MSNEQNVTKENVVCPTWGQRRLEVIEDAIHRHRHGYRGPSASRNVLDIRRNP